MSSSCSHLSHVTRLHHRQRRISIEVTLICARGGGLGVGRDSETDAPSPSNLSIWLRCRTVSGC